MIEIQELKEKHLEDVLNLLLKEEQPFEIYVPKETQIYNSEREAISMDYAALSYSGHLLSQVSEEFEYETVSPGKHESVLFRVTTSDIESLASTMLYISYGYVNDHPEDAQFSYGEEAANYLYEVEQGGIGQVACPYFVEVSREFGQDEASINE